MRGVLINPKTREITEVYSTNGFSNEEVYKLIECDTIDITMIDRNLNVGMIIDDNGFLYANNPVFHLGLGTFAGIGLLLNFTDDGENADLVVPLRSVIEAVTWEDKVSSGEFGPTTEVRRFDGSFEIKMGAPILKEPDNATDRHG